MKTSNQSVVAIRSLDSGISNDHLIQDYELSMLFRNSSENEIVVVSGETEMRFDIPSSIVTRLRMYVDFEHYYEREEEHDYGMLVEVIFFEFGLNFCNRNGEKRQREK